MYCTKNKYGFAIRKIKSILKANEGARYLNLDHAKHKIKKSKPHYNKSFDLESLKKS